jgi:hypothetical protein
MDLYWNTLSFSLVKRAKRTVSSGRDSVAATILASAAQFQEPSMAQERLFGGPVGFRSHRVCHHVSPSQLSLIARRGSR